MKIVPSAAPPVLTSETESTLTPIITRSSSGSGNEIEKGINPEAPDHISIPIEFLEGNDNEEDTVPAIHPKLPIHVGGTPGTGKTAFGLYLLHRLLLCYEDYAFVYRHGDGNPGCHLYYKGCSYYHPSTVQLFDDDLLIQLLTSKFSKAIWTIIDGGAAIPIDTPYSRTIILTSPGERTSPLKHLLKHVTSIINPPWTFDEIETVRRVIYKHLSKELVAAEFKKWGGIPRILFEYANKPEKHQELNDSI